MGGIWGTYRSIVCHAVDYKNLVGDSVKKSMKLASCL